MTEPMMEEESKSPLYTVLDVCDETVGILTSNLSKLEQRLSDVLREEPSENRVAEPSKPAQPSGPAVNRISRQRDRLLCLNDQVQSLLHRLDT